jgi:hypothetical protein
MSADGVRLAYPLLQAGGGGSTPTSALQLFFRTVDLGTAKALNRLWHSRLPIFGRCACRVAYVAEYDGLFYAVAIWTNPLARMLPQTAWMELNRMAVAPDAPRNTPSRMLGWMARDIRHRFPAVSRLISYQDCDSHSGTIYRASGWEAVRVGNPGPWCHGSRHRLAPSLPNKVR